MKYYYQDDYVTIIHGDCREILPTLPKVDLVLTDPPYNVVSNRPNGGLKSAGCFDKGIADKAEIDVENIASAMWSMCKSIYVWCSGEQISFYLKAFSLDGSSVRTCVWEKTNPSPTTSGQANPKANGLWLSALELCAFGRKAGATFNEKNAVPVWRFPCGCSKRHPTEKPLKLFSTIIYTSSSVGDTVLDPFAGSCTTGRAAKDLRRKCICIELEERYCEIGAKRMQQEVLPL